MITNFKVRKLKDKLLRKQATCEDLEHVTISVSYEFYSILKEENKLSGDKFLHNTAVTNKTDRFEVFGVPMFIDYRMRDQFTISVG